MTVCVSYLSRLSLMISFSFVCPWAVFWMPCFDLNHKWAVTTTLRCKENSQLMFSWQPRERCVLYFVWLYGQFKIFHGFLNNSGCIINMSNFLGIFVNDEWMYNFEHQILSSFETRRSSPLCRFPAVSFVIWRKIRIILAHAVLCRPRLWGLWEVFYYIIGI